MLNVGKSRFVLSCFTLLLTACIAVGQSGKGTGTVESLIDGWNSAINRRNLHGLERVYGEKVLTDVGSVNRSTAIAMKQQLFSSAPWLRQRIITQIRHIPQPNGTIKCEFTREVYEKTHWRKYDSYLIIAKENNQYRIVAEGDVLKPQARRRPNVVAENRPDITNEEEPGVSDTSKLPENVSSDSISPTADSTQAPVAVKPSSPIHASDSMLSPTRTNGVDLNLNFRKLDSLFSNLSAMGMITIPKGYVFMLVGMLGLGGLLIFVADSIHSRRRRKPVRDAQNHAEAEHVVRDFKIQAAFEAFVITLFDPLYFKCYRPKSEPVYAGKDFQAEKGPDLVFEFNQKETHVRFAITCQYYLHTARNEVQLLSGDRQDSLRQFEATREMDVYYVLGFGGKPDDPRELFFIPARNVRSEYMTRAELRRYSKSGMFYYNRKSGVIQ